MSISLENPSPKHEGQVPDSISPWKPELLFIVSEVVAVWSKNFVDDRENAPARCLEEVLSVAKKLGTEMEEGKKTIKKAISSAKKESGVLERIAACEERLPACAPYLTLLRVHFRKNPWNKEMDLGELIERTSEEKCADALIQTIYRFMVINLKKGKLGNKKWEEKQKLIPSLAKQLGKELGCEQKKIIHVVKASGEKGLHTEERIEACMKLAGAAPYLETLQLHYKAHDWTKYRDYR